MEVRRMVGNCEDCIHFETCSNWNKKFIDLRIKRQSICGNFKNKADFVEVVKCEKCDYKDDCARQMVHTTRDYVLEQNISTYNKVDFCSCGERKDT